MGLWVAVSMCGAYISGYQRWGTITLNLLNTLIRPPTYSAFVIEDLAQHNPFIRGLYWPPYCFYA